MRLRLCKHSDTGKTCRCLRPIPHPQSSREMVLTCSRGIPEYAICTLINSQPLKSIRLGGGPIGKTFVGQPVIGWPNGRRMLVRVQPLNIVIFASCLYDHSMCWHLRALPGVLCSLRCWGGVIQAFTCIAFEIQIEGFLVHKRYALSTSQVVSSYPACCVLAQRRSKRRARTSTRS